MDGCRADVLDTVKVSQDLLGKHIDTYNVPIYYLHSQKKDFVFCCIIFPSYTMFREVPTASDLFIWFFTVYSRIFHLYKDSASIMVRGEVYCGIKQIEDCLT